MPTRGRRAACREKRGGKGLEEVGNEPKVLWSESCRTGCTVKDVLDSVRIDTTLRAEVAVNISDATLERVKPGAMTGAQLRKSRARGTGERCLIRIDRRRASTENDIGCVCVNKLTDNFHVYLLKNVPITTRINGAVSIKERLDDVNKLRPECMFHRPNAPIQSDDGMGRVMWLQTMQSPNQKLRREKAKVSLHGNDCCFLMQVVNGRGRMTS